MTLLGAIGILAGLAYACWIVGVIVAVAVQRASDWIERSHGELPTLPFTWHFFALGALALVPATVGICGLVWLLPLADEVRLT